MLQSVKNKFLSGTFRLRVGSTHNRALWSRAGLQAWPAVACALAMSAAPSLSGKASFSKGLVSGRDNIMLKVQAILRDGSVCLEFMTDDLDEAEEMRIHCLAFDCLVEV